VNSKISKANAESEYFDRRLDEIRMSGHARLKAKAQFAQAEAIADALVAAVRGIGRLFGMPARKPGRRAATSAG
jgi:hypothetical protein